MQSGYLTDYHSPWERKNVFCHEWSCRVVVVINYSPPLQIHPFALKMDLGLSIGFLWQVQHMKVCQERALERHTGEGKRKRFCSLLVPQCPAPASVERSADPAAAPAVAWWRCSRSTSGKTHLQQVPRGWIWGKFQQKGTTLTFLQWPTARSSAINSESLKGPFLGVLYLSHQITPAIPVFYRGFFTSYQSRLLFPVILTVLYIKLSLFQWSVVPLSWLDLDLCSNRKHHFPIFSLHTSE